MGNLHFKIHLRAFDELELSLEVDNAGGIKAAQLKGIGGPEMLAMLEQWRPRLKGSLLALEIPSGMSGPEIMLREVLLKARNEWEEPYSEEELCHCRAVPTAVVRQAITAGADTPEVVSRWTTASTQCGTCRKDVIALISALRKR